MLFLPSSSAALEEPVTLVPLLCPVCVDVCMPCSRPFLSPASTLTSLSHRRSHHPFLVTRSPGRNREGASSPFSTLTRSRGALSLAEVGAPECLCEPQHSRFQTKLLLGSFVWSLPLYVIPVWVSPGMKLRTQAAGSLPCCFSEFQ